MTVPLTWKSDVKFSVVLKEKPPHHDLFLHLSVFSVACHSEYDMLALFLPPLCLNSGMS